jgi:CubicO group peptidase (beta-lactamase class C family)
MLRPILQSRRRLWITAAFVFVWSTLVAAAVFAEAWWFGEPRVVKGSVQSIEKHLAGKLRAAAKDGRLGTYALVLVHRGKIVSEHGDRRLFQVASVSKAVTAWGVLKLVQDGRISLDAPYRGKVTVRHLLSHTAAGVPGTAMSYSNVNYTELQNRIEEVTGRPFAAFMRDEILRPLGMTESSFDRNELASERIAPAFDEDVVQRPLRPHDEVAAAGLYASARDLGRFVIAFTGNTVLTKATIRRMLEPQPGTSGTWGLGQTLFTRDVAGHDGGAYPAWGAMVRVNPVTGNGMVLLVSGGRGAVNQLGHDWVYWETGEMTPAARRQIVYTRARPASVALFGGIAAFLAFSFLKGRGAR